MGKDELHDALDRAAGHGPERDFTGTWSEGRRMRRRRQAAQGLGVTALAAAAVGAFALGGGDILGANEPINPATPSVPDTVVATTAEPDSDSDGETVTEAAPTPTPTIDEPTETASSAEPTDSAPPPPPTTGPSTEEPTSGGSTGDLIVIPNPCDEPTARLTAKATPDATPATMDRAQELLDLASTCDLDGLIALAEEQGTFLSFGGTSPSAAFSGQEGRDRVHAIATLMANYPSALGTGNDGPLTSAEWPSLTREQWPELVELGIATQLEVDMWEEFGGYIGWRIHIEDDGLWSGMVAGD